MAKGLDADTISLLTRRVYDLAGVTGSGIAIYLNKQKLKIKNFE
jgi:DNA topoisomerase II